MTGFVAISRKNEELIGNIAARNAAASAEFMAKTSLGNELVSYMHQAVKVAYKNGGFVKIPNRKPEPDWVYTGAAADRPELVFVLSHGFDDDGGFLEVAKIGVSKRVLRLYIRGIADIEIIDVEQLADLQPQPG